MGGLNILSIPDLIVKNTRQCLPMKRLKIVWYIGTVAKSTQDSLRFQSSTHIIWGSGVFNNLLKLCAVMPLVYPCIWYGDAVGAFQSLSAQTRRTVSAWGFRRASRGHLSSCSKKLRSPCIMHIAGHQFALSYGGLHELFTTFKLEVDISCLVPYLLNESLPLTSEGWMKPTQMILRINKQAVLSSYRSVIAVNI